jgi:hypothetical protein
MAITKARAWFLIGVCAGLFFFLAPLAAQEDDEDEGGGEEGGGEIPIESDWSGLMPDLYARGDQTLTITLGVLFPTVFTGKGELVGDLHDKIKIGGAGSLAYNYFLNSHLYVGGEVGGMFARTLGKNMIFLVPFGIRVGYQFVLGRFEFPLALMIGGAPQKYLDEGYFGFFMKPSASVFFRFNPDWSFGLNNAWWWVPQWTSNSSENVQANFYELTLSARYHF